MDYNATAVEMLESRHLGLCLFVYEIVMVGRNPVELCWISLPSPCAHHNEITPRIIAIQAGLGNNYHAMYASCQSRAAGLAKAVTEDKKVLAPNYTNMQVWKNEVDNTDLHIRFWEVIDRKKAREILEVEKGLKTAKIRYLVKQTNSKTAAGKVSKHWVKKIRDGYRGKQWESPEKDGKRKHESHHH
uniref:Uncharacterized protein n=1 Tax=Romanomermis culicivorax TaxID=13658 RepID=A0A915LA74_ROMCU